MIPPIMTKAYPELSPIIIPYNSHGFSDEQKKRNFFVTNIKIFFNQKSKNTLFLNTS